MPYSSITELPNAIQKFLPEHAQEIFREAFNNTVHAYHEQEERAFQVAWHAVKQVYAKEGSKWIKKPP